MYSEVNVLLKQPLKAFIKNIVCTPERITCNQFDTCIDLMVSEKVHVVLLAMEARKQSELMYAMSAVLHHLS